MLQRVFTADLDPAGRPPAQGAGRPGAGPVRIGIVCPYSCDVPGGVQFARPGPGRGADRRWATRCRCSPRPTTTPPLPPYVVAAGRAVPVPLQRLGGPARRSASCPRAGCGAGSSEGEFDVLHVHEPSIAEPVPAGLLGGRRADRRDVPHRDPALPRAAGRLPGAAAPAWRRSTAGSRCPRRPGRTLVEHIGGDAVVIPNGVAVGRYRQGRPAARLAGPGRRDRLPRPDRRAAQGPAGAARRVRRCSAAHGPGLRLLVAGPRRRRGRAATGCPPALRDRVVLLGQVSEEDKVRAAATRSTSSARRTPAARASASCSPRRWRPGRPIVASDLDAFRQVLRGGEAGELFPTGDAGDLAGAAGPAAGRPGPPGRVP